MAQVTQRVDPRQLADLLERPPRAAIAFSRGSSIEPVPVAHRRSGARSWVGISREALPAEGPGDRAVLLLDDGRYWFELVPDRVVAWDYGTLHEERGS